LRSAEAAFNPLNATLNGICFSLSASADFVDCAEGHLAELAEAQRQPPRTERDAVDRRGNERLGALHLVAVAELSRDHVAAGRGALAVVRHAVPAEPHRARILRAEVDTPDELPVRGEDLHLDRGRALRQA